MIFLGLVGVADPRHQWFLAARARRRAGVRVVGFAEPDPVLREQAAEQHDLPGFADPQSLIESVAPTMLALACPDPGPVLIDGLQRGLDLLVLPPVCATAEQTDRIAELCSSGRRVTAVHDYRGHPAARTAQELLTAGRLGDLELVSVIIDGDCDDDRRRSVIADGLDLLEWLTGERAETVTAIGDGHPLRAEDPAEAQQTWGELILVAGHGDPAAGGVGLEIRLRGPGAERPAETVQLVGNRGAVEWDVRTGRLRSALDGRDPVTVDCGRFDPAEWVLTRLIRRSRPDISTESSLAATRLVLQAEPRGRIELPTFDLQDRRSAN